MRIIYKNGASETIQFAAQELEKYLKSMLVQMPEDGWEISLCVDRGIFSTGGKKLQKSPQADAFRVELGKCGGRMTGSNDRSVLLAVYDYLHRLGCRFLVPKKEFEIIPHISKEQLETAYEKRASFRHRGVCIEGADSLENILDYVDWLPKAGFNSFFLQFKNPYAFLARWYRHEGNPYAASEIYTAAEAERDMVLIETEVKKRGLMLHKAGHGWTGEVLGFQTVSWETEERKTGAYAALELSEGSEHSMPENRMPKSRSGVPQQESICLRMAMIDGHRQLFHGVPANTNLCYHNTEAAEAFISLVADYAQKNPYADYVHVWLADEYNNLCECKDCRSTTLADQYVDLLNEIDKRLTQKNINTRIVFLLYQELLWPPKESRIKNPDRFVLMFAPISRTFEKSYDLPKEALSMQPVKLPVFIRNQITLPSGLAENLAFLKGWQTVFQGDSFIYDYPLGRAHYGDFGYVHIAKVIHSDIQKLEQMGLHGYISCQELRAAFPNALPNYMMGRTLFSKEVSAEAVMEEYFQACYGKDWEWVLAYLSKLSLLSSCDYVNGKGERIDAETAERMQRIKEHCIGCADMIRAHQSPDGVWESIFWQILEYHRKYVILFAEALKQLALGNQPQADCGWKKLRDEICIHEPEYQPFLDVYRILEVTKKYTGFCAGE